MRRYAWQVYETFKVWQTGLRAGLTTHHAYIWTATAAQPLPLPQLQPQQLKEPVSRCLWQPPCCSAIQPTATTHQQACDTVLGVPDQGKVDNDKECEGVLEKGQSQDTTHSTGVNSTRLEEGRMHMLPTNMPREAQAHILVAHKQAACLLGCIPEQCARSVLELADIRCCSCKLKVLADETAQANMPAPLSMMVPQVMLQLWLNTTYIAWLLS
jgi:hypothetical protein